MVASDMDRHYLCCLNHFDIYGLKYIWSKIS